MSHSNSESRTTSTTEILHNVRDCFARWIGPWEVEPLVYDRLGEADVGRWVIYDCGAPGVACRREVGKLTGWDNDRVWARFHTGDTSACCDPSDLRFGIRSVPIDEILGAKQ